MANTDWGTQLRLMSKPATETKWFAVADGSGFHFVNGTSGLYLDIWGGDTANGAAVTQWRATGGTNQLFSLIAP